jgi:hypothetical protein
MLVDLRRSLQHNFSSGRKSCLEGVFLKWIAEKYP